MRFIMMINVITCKNPRCRQLPVHDDINHSVLNSENCGANLHASPQKYKEERRNEKKKNQLLVCNFT